MIAHGKLGRMLLKLTVTFLLGLYVIIRRDDSRVVNVHKLPIEIVFDRIALVPQPIVIYIIIVINGNKNHIRPFIRLWKTQVLSIHPNIQSVKPILMTNE